MGRLVYGTLTSLDGYVADADGGFDWAMPADDVLEHITDLEGRIGTYLYGRRMFEIMSFWADPPLDQLSDPERAYAAGWGRAHKVVYSTTLEVLGQDRCRLEASFAAEDVRRLLAEAPGDVSISGPTLAAHAFAAGLVDEVHLYVCPVVVGGGTPWAPSGVEQALALRDTRVFASGIVYLRYDVVE